MTLLVLIPLAWAYLEDGDLPAAAGTIEEAIQRAHQAGYRPALVDALRVRADLHRVEGRAGEAEHDLREAVDIAGPIPYPYGEARALQSWARLELSRGDQKAARRRLEAARAIFRRLEARPYLERVERELAALE